MFETQIYQGESKGKGKSEGEENKMKEEFCSLLPHLFLFLFFSITKSLIQTQRKSAKWGATSWTQPRDNRARHHQA